MDLRRSILTAIVILSAVIVIIIGIYALHDENGNEDGQPVTATLSIDFGNARSNATVTYENLTVSSNNATVYGLTKAAAEEGNFTIDTTYYGQYDSLFIDGIDGIVNGQNNSYWQYTVNGTAGAVGADRHPVTESDHVTWTFQESQFGG
ncbi:MAG: DUF4430 domain-containing protein [Thermoplasmatota archaeon]